jgi:hypothetical protein
MGPEFFQTVMGHRFYEKTMPDLVEAIKKNTAETKRLAEVMDENNRLLKRAAKATEPVKASDFGKGFVIVFPHPCKDAGDGVDHYWRGSDKQIQPDLAEATVYSQLATADCRVSEILDLINRGERNLIRLDFPIIMRFENGKLLPLKETTPQ